MKHSYWIWYYGDYEIYHLSKLHMRREQRGAFMPSMWHLYSPYPSVFFEKKLVCEAGTLTAYAMGEAHIAIDGKRYPMGTPVAVSAGEHTVTAAVSNLNGLPALFVESDVCPSDGTWRCRLARGESLPAGCEPCFDTPDKTPDVFPFAYERKLPVSAEAREAGVLYDFGAETFGYLNLSAANPDATLGVYYGESVEEALGGEDAILFEAVCGQSEYRLRQRAFRYVYVEGADPTLNVTMDYEFLPLIRRGSFRCDNELFNRIYDVCAHTFHLNCREGFFDGIKRDRWVWSGDAYQSARINSYLFADPAIVRRTAIGLGGKDPILHHINTIADYTTLWIIGLYEHYMTYGDEEFLRLIYPTAVKYMDFCRARLNENGFLIGLDGDWIFVDWSEMDKTGAVCAEQMLLAQAYKTMAALSRLVGKDGAEYDGLYREMIGKINAFYWNEEKGAFIDSYQSGKNHVTRHANIFAVMYDIATPVQRESILTNVLKNDAITKITTPYFEGYELDVWGKVGELGEIEAMLDSYWGGMLRLGATSIWEEYDPTLSGVEHYAMYGGKFEKSLCHAWGASPIYLFGRYYLGVAPTSPAYATFDVEPHLGGLREMEGTVPTGNGEVRVKMDAHRLSVRATTPGGTLRFRNRTYPLPPNEDVVIEY
ncbi:MAG: alpha-rhamnosidase [Clostridia bacterium]|nr:alpha-rhamnosidase [Clostridia bacterium]